jgi:hypothetical protein
MKTKSLLLLSLLILLLVSSCFGRASSLEEETPVPAAPTQLTASPTAEPPASTVTPTPEPTRIYYQPAFGIDYAQPELFLEQGEQSQIPNPSVLDGLRAGEQSLENLGKIYHWLKSEFTPYKAGGRTIGVVTVEELLESRRLGGCHDHGLVYAAVARELGYPALMARTSSIAWMEGFQAGKKGPHIGHVFVEVFLDGRWVLIDSTNGWYVEEGYDPTDPVIPLKGPIAGSNEEIYGFYVERKGIDTWGFGIHSPEESTKAMDELANRLDLGSIEYPEYTIQRFTK